MRCVIPEALVDIDKSGLSSAVQEATGEVTVWVPEAQLLTFQDFSTGAAPTTKENDNCVDTGLR